MARSQDQRRKDDEKRRPEAEESQRASISHARVEGLDVNIGLLRNLNGEQEH
jgi:hypothetical protein